MGGSLVDSSPMYGTAQQVLGHCLDRLERPDGLFAATKVWIPGRLAGINQAQRSARLWGVDKFDLLMVHNMVDWETHLETLQQWKADGRLRYHGITTSHGRRQQQMESVVCKQPFDFIQFTYNIVDREAERLLLPLAQEHGKAVILNRPFRGGSLFRYVRNKSLPGWAAEIDVQNWAQYFLKFAVSHPAVTCAIPATSRVDHMVENMGALQGPLPDEALRREMVAYFERIRA